MTGEDMIIEEAARLLKRRGERDAEELHALRTAFRIAGRCEWCGSPSVDVEDTLCVPCKDEARR